MPINWPRFVELVRKHNHILLVSHVRPDCDALGSELGMCGILEALGKRVTICNAQATPPNLAFIDPQKKIKALGVDIKPEQLADVDLLMVLDTSAWAQLGAMGDVIRGLKITKIVLDHHQSNDDLGAEWFKDTDAEATGRLVFDASKPSGQQRRSADVSRAREGFGFEASVSLREGLKRTIDWYVREGVEIVR